MSKPKSPKPDKAFIKVRVVPRSSQSKIAGEPDGSYKVWVNAPPVDGAANDAVCSLIAEALKVPKNTVEMVSGHTSRSKVIQVAGLTQVEVSFRLGPKAS